MKRKLLAVIALAIPGTLAACGGGNAGTGNNPSTSAGTTSTCPTGTQTSGNGATLSIGSKAFAEEELMAQMTADVLGAHGFTITNTFQAKDKAIGTAESASLLITSSGPWAGFWPRAFRLKNCLTKPLFSQFGFSISPAETSVAVFVTLQAFSIL